MGHSSYLKMKKTESLFFSHQIFGKVTFSHEIFVSSNILKSQGTARLSKEFEAFNLSPSTTVNFESNIQHPKNNAEIGF